MRKGRLRTVTVALAAALVFAGALAAGCGKPLLSDPQTIVKNAIEAQKKLKSVRMELDVDVDLTALQDPSQVASTSSSGEGFFEQPDKSKVAIKSGGRTTEVITIGDQVYVKLPGSDIWMQRDVSENLAKGLAPGDVADYLKNTENLELVDRRGETYHLKFDLDMGRYTRDVHVPGVDPSMFTGTKARMEVWVRKDDFYIDKLNMNFAGDLKSLGGGHLAMAVQIDFSDFNDPVTIEAPI